MKRARKLLYVPGLISLVGILIMLPSFYKRNIAVKEYCITMFVPQDCNGDKNRDWTLRFATCNLETEIKKRNQIRFTLDNNKKDNERKMEMIRYEALKLKYTEDTSTVILINLTDSIRYGDFISIADMCEADGHKRYASWGNKFVIFGEWPEKKIEKSNSICFFCNDLIRIKEPIAKPTLFKLINQNVKKYYTPQGLYLLLGWGMLLISFLIFKRKNSILKKN